MATRPPAEAEAFSPGRLGAPVPTHRGELVASGGRWAGGLAPRLVIGMVPYGWRWAHWAYAAVFRRFWWPCAACRRTFGGHEWRDAGGNPGTIPAAAADLEVLAVGRAGLPICPPCTLAEVGTHRWALVDRGRGSRLATAAEVDNRWPPLYDDHWRPPYDDDDRRQDWGPV